MMNKGKIFKLAKGFRGRAKNCIRIARERVEKSLQYAFRDRRTKKRDMRSLWITRITAGSRQYGVSCRLLPACAAARRYCAAIGRGAVPSMPSLLQGLAAHSRSPDLEHPAAPRTPQPSPLPLTSRPPLCLKHNAHLSAGQVLAADPRPEDREYRGQPQDAVRAGHE